MMQRWRQLLTFALVLGVVASTVVWLPQQQVANATPVEHAFHKMQSAGFLELTMRGCPDGVMPQNVDPEIECTTPLDAPEVSIVSWGGTNVSVPPMPRNYNGTYQFDVPGGIELRLSGFEPAVRDAFLAVGADSVDSAGNPLVTVPAGETRYITFYYYNYTGDAPPPVETVPLADITIDNSFLGWPFTTACYELANYSENLCSQRLADMSYGVVFTNVEAGTYTVRQTADLGDAYVRDFTIEVTGEDQKLHVSVIPSWGSPSRNNEPHLNLFEEKYGIQQIEVDTSDPDFWNTDTNHVIVVFMDTTSQSRVISNGCVQIMGQSNVSCDTGRGQIDILDVSPGDHEVKITQLPEGYELAPGMEDLRIRPIGRNPHAPLQIVYVIDVVPVGAGSVVASPAADAPAGDTLLTICAGNRHGVDYPAYIFNLPLDVAVAMGFVILDDDGNPHPEWPGVSLEPCQIEHGFHLWEYVESPQSTVAYCFNGQDMTSPAENLGMDFVDPHVSGQALSGGYQFANWRTAPEGMIPGSCDAPVALDGNAFFQAMIGEWVGVNRSAVINADGTGVVTYSDPISGAELTFTIKVDIGTYPVMATVSTVNFTGSPDLSSYPRVGQRIEIRLAPAFMLFVELTPPDSVGYCRSLDQPYSTGNCD